MGGIDPSGERPRARQMGMFGNDNGGRNGGERMRKVDIDTSLLRCFVAVADAGGFTAAVDRTHLTQSGISLRIRKLEEILQLHLIHRTSRTFKLTPQGDMLLGYAKRLLALNDEAFDRLSRPNLSGQLRVGIAEYLAPLSLHRILHRFREHYPQLRLEVVIGLGQDLAPDFARGNLDLAVAGEGTMLENGEPLFEEEMSWVGGPTAHDHGEAIHLVTLPAPCRFRRAAMECLQAQSRQWEVSLVCSSIAGIQQGLRAGFGVSVLPISSIPPDLQQIGVAEHLGPLPKHRIFAFRKEMKNPIAERFLDYLTDELASERTFTNLRD
jgi:DNA-binding transcriptional LysR family regulator